MRTRYLVSYDICNPKRLRQVAKTMEGYGMRLQYSVFECALDGKRVAKLKADLHEILHHEEDQVLFVSLGPEAALRAGVDSIARALQSPRFQGA
jgi:CRISPR-associated protein Cas2